MVHHGERLLPSAVTRCQSFFRRVKPVTVQFRGVDLVRSFHDRFTMDLFDGLRVAGPVRMIVPGARALPYSLRTSEAGLSFRTPTNNAWRRLPPAVHSVNAFSTTTRGFTQRRAAMSSAVMPSPQWRFPVLFGKFAKGQESVVSCRTGQARKLASRMVDDDQNRQNWWRRMIAGTPAFTSWGRRAIRSVLLRCSRVARFIERILPAENASMFRKHQVHA